MKTDIEISNETQLKNIEDIAKKVGINPETIEPYGHYIAKIPLSYIDEEKIKKSRCGRKAASFVNGHDEIILIDIIIVY